MVVQKPGNVHMITARTDTMNAVAPLTDSVITTPSITVTALCLLLLVLGAALSVEASRHQIHILSLGFETPSVSPALHGGTSTETTGGDVLIGLTITVVAGHLIPHSRDTLPHNGPQDKHRKLLIPPNELLCLLAEARALDPEVDRPALIQSAAQAVLAVAAVIQTQAPVMDLVPVLFSRQQLMHLHSLRWY